MADHRDRVYLDQMLLAATKARDKVRDIPRPSFDSDENLQYAVVHLLQTVGEAGRRVSEDTRSRLPDIPWALIVGMRHKIVHDYTEINLDIVWDTATGDLDPLIATLREALGETP